MYNNRIVSALHCIVLTAVGVSADIIDITLDSNPAYVSDELEAYLHYANGVNEPLVGFNAANIGDGRGDGVDEAVAFSFVFQPLTYIKNAYLTIDLTPRGAETDELLFSDNISIRGEGIPGAKFYGNLLLRSLPSQVRTSVTFDLERMDYTDPYKHYLGMEDLSVFLYDGDFNVVYADDAIIHSARLRINTGLPQPPSPPEPPCHVPEAKGLLMYLVALVFTVYLKINVDRKRVKNGGTVGACCA